MKLNRENDLLTNYLPKEIDEHTIRAALQSIDFSQAKNFGQAIGMAMKHFKNEIINKTVDASLVKLIVESIYKK